MASPQEIRQRLKDDFEFYSKNCIKIRTKNNEVATLTLNAAQRKLHEAVEKQRAETGKVRIIILKARQQGFSTYVHGRLYWKLSQRKARKGLVVAHDATSTKALFDMYRRTHKEMPELMRPSTSYSSRKEFVFDQLDTGLMVATAGGEGISRGETISDAHLSEVAFWPKGSAADNLNGLLQAIPDSPDTDVFLESTANGMSGVFYEMWKGAVEGTNGFIAFFSPWFDSPEYALQGPDFELTYEEIDLVAQYGLTKEQLRFRRKKVSEGGLEKFRQEYPSNAEEAFIASGYPVFNLDQIHEMLKYQQPPDHHRQLEDGTWRRNPRGPLKMWRKRDYAETYYIGADVAMGIKGRDYSVAQVLDGQKNLVASYRAHIHPDAFADVLYALGLYFNEARIIVESNNHGLLTAVRLGRDLAYPNMYTEFREGTLLDEDSFTLGFRTTTKTKPLVIDRLRAALRENEIAIWDPLTLREMLSYVVTESGAMEAEAGNHDDCVMALAFANHIHDGKFTPITVTDDYYVPAL